MPAGFGHWDFPYHSHEDDHGEESTPDDDDDDDGHAYNRVACSEYTQSKAQHSTAYVTYQPVP
jgi:hypothetical protein